MLSVNILNLSSICLVNTSKVFSICFVKYQKIPAIPPKINIRLPIICRVPNFSMRLILTPIRVKAMEV
jgi:hypothetical protein